MKQKSKKLLSLLLALTMIMSMLSVSAFAAEDDGQSSGEISTTEAAQAALDAAKDGDTIVLQGGSYGTLYIRNTADDTIECPAATTISAQAIVTRSLSNVTIKAAEGAEVTVAGLMLVSGAGSANTKYAQSELLSYLADNGVTGQQEAGQYKAIIKTSNITIDSIDFTGSLDVQVNSVPESEVENWHVQNCSFTGAQLKLNGSTLKADAQNLNNISIENCTFKDYTVENAIGVYIQNGGNITIKNCSFDDITKNGISINNYQYGTVSITGNTFSNIGDRAIRIGEYEDSTQLTITGNTFDSTACNQTELEFIKATGITGQTVAWTNADVSDNVIVGGTAEWQDGLYVLKLSPVAKIGEITYTTLQNAVSAAVDEDTIILLCDVALPITEGQDRLTINKNLTIDLNNNTISSADGDDIFYLTDGATLTVEHGIMEAGRIAIYSYGNGSSANTITLEDVWVKSNYWGVYHNGSNFGANIAIRASVIEDGSEEGAGIFLSGSNNWTEEQFNNLTIQGSNVSGASAVEVKRCNITIDSYTVTDQTGLFVWVPELKANDETASMESNGNGSCSTGYALALTNCIDSTMGSATIACGSFIGAVGIQTAANGTNSASIAISGGIFSTAPSAAYLADGKAVVANVDEDTKEAYPFAIGTAVVIDVNTEVAAGDNAVSVNTEGKTEEVASAMNDLSSAIVNNLNDVPVVDLSTSTEAHEIANDENIITEELIAQATEGLGASDGDVVTIVVETYMDVKTEDATVDDGVVCSITVDITPMYNLIATTATTVDQMTDDNSEPLGEPQTLNITTPVVVSIPLPTVFADKQTSISIIHKKEDGRQFIYNADITTIDGVRYAVFANPNGFSGFTLLNKTVAAYTVTVEGGVENNSSYQAGDSVTISAGTKSGYTFTGWTTTTDGVTFADPSAKNTTFTMPGSDVTVKANWSYNGSSGGGVSTYAITIEDSVYGKVTADKQTASSGTTVTLTVTPDTGYALETLTVTKSNGAEIELTEKDGKYTFRMPASKVTVAATFMEDSTMLNYFVDVFATDYYYDAVMWAVEVGITNGTSDTTFSPDATCTRAQMATFLWRAAGCPDPVSNVSPFDDVPSDAYYAKAVQWAVEKGITYGTSATTFSPDAECTRAQMATFLWRNANTPTVGNSTNPFTDVPAGAYYTTAVQWAYEQEITTGTTDTTFSPDAICTRGQMVTFLYRNFAN